MTSITEEQPASTQPAPKLHPDTLGRYRDPEQQQRELRSLDLADGRRVVVDWRAAGRTDARVVGVLAADEPPENAAILASVYLADPLRGRCRALRATDLRGALSRSRRAERDVPSEPLHDDHGAMYEIRVLRETDSYPELRWVCVEAGEARVLCLRAVVGRVQSYGPALALTRGALAAHEQHEISTCTLRAELQRVEASPFVLNRRLREVVLARAAR